MRRCSCRACRRALHSPYGKAVARRITRAFRQTAKRQLAAGDEPRAAYSMPRIG